MGGSQIGLVPVDLLMKLIELFKGVTLEKELSVGEKIDEGGNEE